uniref:Endo-1,4-beta-xylanase A n=1 Tax=uncultured bacterium contig00113 TaxID=1181576 RepID=A0A806KLM5_9BACT|nr:endo-1,4-beta-xylanase A precursor [uncultured bacterium contig00113]
MSASSYTPAASSSGGDRVIGYVFGGNGGSPEPNIAYPSVIGEVPWSSNPSGAYSNVALNTANGNNPYPNVAPVPTGSTVLYYQTSTNPQNNNTFVLEFNLGSTTLADYTGIEVYMRGQNQKDVKFVAASGASGGSFTDISGNQSNFYLNNQEWLNKTATFTGSTLSSLTGVIRIGLCVTSSTNNEHHQIKYIKLTGGPSGGGGGQNSTINPTSATFDKGSPANVTTTMTLQSGHTLDNVKNGGTNLTLNTDYSVSGSTVTINSSYLSAQANGTVNLTFDFSAGTDPVFAITVSGSAPVSNSISPTTATFAKSNSASHLTVTTSGNALLSINNNGTNLVNGTDYSVSGSTVTINTWYLNTLANGNGGTGRILTFVFSSGSNQTLTLNVSGTAPSSTISPTSMSYDKSSPSTVSTTMTLNSNRLVSITNNGITLTLGSDYTVSGSVVTISQSYLNGLANGNGGTGRILTFTFSSGTTSTRTFTLNISGTAPVGGLPSVGQGVVYTGNNSASYRNLFTEIGGKTSQQVSDKVTEAWNAFFAGTVTTSTPNTPGETRMYVEVGGDKAYIWDTGNNDVRSEGMSYGMMMAVQMNNQTVFNKLWKWARDHMYNDRAGTGGANRGYYAWKVSTGGSKQDSGPAPDGEIYFTTALLFADARWTSASGTSDIFNYRQRARELLYDMCHRESKDGSNQAALFRRPGDHSTNNTVANPMAVGNYQVVFSPNGNSSTHTDPSYHLPAFYEIWAMELERDYADGNTYGVWATLDDLWDDAEFYRTAAQTSRAFFKTATHNTTGLSADYSNFDGSPTGQQNYFAFDAFRTAMNIAMDYAWFAPETWHTQFADRIQTFFQGPISQCSVSGCCTNISNYKGTWALPQGSSWQTGTVSNRPTSGDAAHDAHHPGLVAMNAAASMAAANTTRAAAFLDDFWSVAKTTGQYRYYDGCLYMLGMLHVTGNFKAYLRPGTAAAPPSPATLGASSATFNQSGTVSVTMNLNGNSLVSIKKIDGTDIPENASGYSVSGNTVTFSNTFLTGLYNGANVVNFKFTTGKAIPFTINVTGSAIGAGNGGTSYNFANHPGIQSITTYNAGITVEWNSTDSALQVNITQNYQSNSFDLPFSLGGNLSAYTKVTVKMRGVSGGYDNKSFTLRVGGPSGTQIATEGNTALTTAWKEVTMNLTNTSGISGNITVNFAQGNSGVCVYQIQTITFHN